MQQQYMKTVSGQGLQHSGVLLYAVADSSLQLIEANDLFLKEFFRYEAGYFTERNALTLTAHQCLQQPGETIALEEHLLPGKKLPEQWFLWEVTAIYNSVKSHTELIFVGKEITAQKNQEADMFYQTNLLEHISDAVIFTDRNFIIKSWNKAAEQIYHYTSEQQIGQSALTIFTYEYLKGSKEEAAKKLMEDDIWQGEVYFKRHDDHAIVYLQSTVTSIRNINNELLGYVAVNRDITALRNTQQELLVANKQQQQYLEAFTRGVVIQNQKGEIILCNQAAEQMLGLTMQQMQGITSVDPSWQCMKADYSPFPGEEHPAMIALKTGKPVEDVIMGVKKSNGSFSWIKITSNPIIKNDALIPDAVVSTFSDITQEQTAYTKLHESEEKMQAFMNASNEGFHMIDPSFNIVLANEASRMIMKNAIQNELTEGMNILEHLPAERKEAVRTQLEKVFQGEQIEYEVLYNFLPGGRPVWLSINGNPVYNKQKEVSFACIIYHDITARKEENNLLKANEERLRLALEKTGDNAWEHNFETGFTWFSSTNNHFLGYTPEELNEKGNEDLWWKNTHPDDKAILQQNDMEYKQGKRDSHTNEYRIRHKNGSIKWVLDRGVVIEKNSKGMPLRIVGTHTDITNEKIQQQKLIGEEQQKKKEVLEAAIQAQEKEREEISYELHEEVSQALSSVKMLLEMALQAPENKSNYIQVAEDAIGKAVADLRDISQGINSSTLRMVGLPAAMEDVINIKKSETAIRFSLDTKDFNESSKIDFSVQLTLFRIFQEALRNIILHSQATEARFELLSSKSFVQLFIRDNGKGFDKNESTYGLGVKNIIHRAEQYNGNVEIVSAPGKGCLLQLIFPAILQERK